MMRTLLITTALFVAASQLEGQQPRQPTIATSAIRLELPWSDFAQTPATLNLPARPYGLGNSTRLVRHDEKGIHQLGVLGKSADSLRVPFAPLQGVVLELIP